MLLLATILLIIGLGDILRVLLPSGVSAAWTVVGIGGLAGAVLLSAGFLTGLPWWSVGLCVIPILLWFITVSADADAPTPSVRHAAPRVLGFVVISAVITVLGDSLIGGTDALPVPMVGRFGVEFAALAMGVTAFHIVSANALVRLALNAEQRGTQSADSDLVVRKPQLKGGRWIGPLERITLTGLLVAGAYPVVAGLIAAKGIIRFPEMHEDRALGNKAEYFLVGSFVSWTVAIVAAGILWTVR
ncbi:hypothetical protein FEF26_03265 [Nesterenkonia salmonea]|uniref:Uncharacterized protein n=1 Tax=Nesterenkonia salmonea TaxID=1804987 RepID=A0A5R9BG35_9MICC|nr:hypothetical protein [Nesterenkonia salmonea]TLP99082.1 hypothetical protein FEF26_03265 [Nesterenkonia salmonea]